MEVFERYQDHWRALYQGYGIYPRSRVFVSDTALGHIHALEIGEGEPLVLLHGFGSNSDVFANLLLELSKSFRVIIPDMPGTGLSGNYSYQRANIKTLGVRFLKSIFDYLGIDSAYIAGVDVGSYIAYNFARTHPHRVKKLLFVGPLLGYNESIPFSLKLLTVPLISKNSLPGESRLDVNGSRIFYDKFFVKDIDNIDEQHLSTCHFASVLPGVISSYFAIFQNFFSIWGIRKKYWIGEDFTNLRVPYQFIIGDADSYFRKEWIELNQYEPILFLKNAGHFCWMDNPKDFISELRVLFLSNHEEKPGSTKLGVA